MSAPPPILDDLARRLADPAGGTRVVRGRPGRAGRKAAVLILFSGPAAATPADLEVVVVEKSPLLRKHAGQCAFPGGGVDPTDASAEAAALREAREEVGIEPEDVHVLGVLPPAHVAATGYDVTSVVGWWPKPRVLSVVDTVEIGAVHAIRVGDLIDPANRVTWRLPMGYEGPAFVVGELFIWGFTGYLIDGLLDLAGWAQPWDPRRLAVVPERFLHRAGRDTGQ
ncbi:MAG: CoA pyrophosphatase [Propionibacteriaceae bacterium]|nr:CoA pyrophosphatase [Propionibacteriaceae bacterium]